VARKEAQERRNEVVQARVTARERQQLEKVAARENLTLSEAARQAILKDLRGATNIVERGRPQGRESS